MSAATAAPVRAWKVSAVTNRCAAGVSATRTCAPAFTSRRATSQDLYAAMPPPTQRSTRRPWTAMLHDGSQARSIPLLLYGPRAEATSHFPRHPRRARGAADRRGGAVLGTGHLPALDHRAGGLALEGRQPGRTAVPGGAPARGRRGGVGLAAAAAAGGDLRRPGARAADQHGGLAHGRLRPRDEERAHGVPRVRRACPDGGRAGPVGAQGHAAPQGAGERDA